MCEKCGFSGCNHDWKKWQHNWYSRGYDDAINGRSANPPELMLGESGYMAGYEKAQRDYRERNLTQRAADGADRCTVCGDLMEYHALPCEPDDENGECHCNAEHAHMTYIAHDKDCPAAPRR